MWKLSVLEADQGEKIDTGCLSWLTTMRPRGGGGGGTSIYKGRGWLSEILK